MGAFDHVVLLLSFVFALALTHLLSRVGAMLLAGRTVRFSSLQALAIVNTIATIYANWLLLWDLRGVKDWDLLSITIWFVFAIQNYFLCVAAGPEADKDDVIDMEQYYWSNRKLLYWLFLAGAVLGVATSYSFLKVPDARLFFRVGLYTLPSFLPPILALAVPVRWAQWVSGLATLADVLWWLANFSGVLR